MGEIDETWYTVQDYNGIVYETMDVFDAKWAVRERREVSKETRKLFRSGKSDIRTYVSTILQKRKTFNLRKNNDC